MIIPYRMSVYGIDLYLLVEIDDLFISNNGVGWTQYGSHWSFDHGEDSIDDYSIESISINTTEGWKPIPMDSKLAKRLCGYIFSSDDFIEAIWKELDAERKESMVERYIDLSHEIYYQERREYA